VTKVPVVADDVSDLDGLREVGARLAAGDEAPEAPRTVTERPLRSARAR
jgi:hypothetical protein